MKAAGSLLETKFPSIFLGFFARLLSEFFDQTDQPGMFILRLPKAQIALKVFVDRLKPLISMMKVEQIAGKRCAEHPLAP